MYEKIFKNEKVPFTGILIDEREFEKIQKDKEILDKIDGIVKQQNTTFSINKNT